MPPTGPRWMRVLVVLACLVASMQVAAQSTDQCTVVFGQGRNFSETNPASNQAWDTINRLFNTQVVVDLSAANWRSIQHVLSVQASDLQANVAGLLARVERESCTRVIETALFGNPEAELLVARVRVYPVLRVPRTGATTADGTVPSIGRAIYTVQRDFQLSQRALDRLDPENLAKEMTADLLKALPMAANATRQPAD